MLTILIASLGANGYEKAKTALDVMAASRMEKLGRTVTELRGGLGEMGGLTGNEEYQEARQIDLETDTGATKQTVVGVHNTRKSAKRDKGILPSFRAVIRSLSGGSFGIGGLYQMAEDLGVHGGPGTERITRGVNDMGLASSDRGNFDAVELGGVIFGGRGDHKSSTDQRKIDNSDVMGSLEFVDSMPGTELIRIRDSLGVLKRRAEELDNSSDKLYAEHPFTRESAEILRNEKYADNKSWLEARDQNQEFLFTQEQQINANISQLNRERGAIYLRLLSDRLAQAKGHFNSNSQDKRQAAIRVLGKPDAGAFDAWLDRTIASVNQSQVNGQNAAKLAKEESDRFEAGLATETDISDGTKEATRVQFNSANAQNFNTQPRDISAPEFIRIANLFGGNTKAAKGNVQTALAMRAIGDIAKWQVDDRLYDVTVDGLPSLNKTTRVVKDFLNKLDGVVRDKKTGKVKPEDVRPEFISDEDIVELLRSKNIYLRDGTRIGSALAGRTGAGVESRPFEKLLFDLTGASKWKGATYAQRLLMYSRLLQLPAHYTARGNPEEQRFLEGKGQENFMPLFLPDFYHNQSIDNHIDFMTDRVAAITEQGDFEFPSLKIGTLRQDTKDELGRDFDITSYDEALARLIETGVFRPTDAPAPEVVLSPDAWAPPVQALPTPTDESQIAMGLEDSTAQAPTGLLGTPKRSSWVNLLKNYLGVEGKKPQFPWGTTPDSEISSGKNVSKEQKLKEKWAPVIRNIFSEVSPNTEIEFLKANDEALRTRNDDGSTGVLGIALYDKEQDKIFINNGRVQKLARLAMAKGGISTKDRQELGLANSNKYLNFVKTIEKEFYDADEVMLFVVAHELAHVKYPPQEAGVTIRLNSDAEGKPDMTVPMNFKDGHITARSTKLTMVEEFKDQFTYDLVVAGLRTATSRYQVEDFNPFLEWKRAYVPAEKLNAAMKEASEEYKAALSTRVKILTSAKISVDAYMQSMLDGDAKFTTKYPEQARLIEGLQINEKQERLRQAKNKVEAARLRPPKSERTGKKKTLKTLQVGDIIDFIHRRPAVEDIDSPEYKARMNELDYLVRDQRSKRHPANMDPDSFSLTGKLPNQRTDESGEDYNQRIEEFKEYQLELSSAVWREMRRKSLDRMENKKRIEAGETPNAPTKEQKVRVRVTKGWTKLTDINPKYWSMKEGWDLATYAKLAKQGYWQFEYEVVDSDTGQAYAAYENDINQRALVEVDRYMRKQASDLYNKRKLEDASRETERLPDAVSNSRVRFNVNYKPLEDSWAPTTEGMTQPGDARVKDEEFWVGTSKPQLVNKLLSDRDAKWAGQVDDLLAAYNEKNTDKPISREDYVSKYTALITSTMPLQELNDLGILNTVQGAVQSRYFGSELGNIAPTESLLELGTAEGRSLVQSLMKAGALPTSLQDNVHAMRRRFIDTMKTRFEVLDKNFEEVVKSLRLPDNIQRQYVDDWDGMYQFLGDVAISGERMQGVRALYDAPGNRIIINLATVDPNDMVSAQVVVKDAAFHEGLHALIMRDHLLEEELIVLRNFVRNEQNIVPKEIDQEAHDAKVTWFERAIAQHKDSELTEGDIENEAIVSLLQNMVRNPGAYVAGKKTRKIGNDLRGFLEKVVGAAKDADIVDVMKILSRIERGEVGERGSGFGFIEGEQYTTASIIRSNRLLRYANPKDITELRKAVVLRDAAISDQMRQKEQAKVDAIADRITDTRNVIRGSAGPIPDTATNIENEKERDEDINATARGSVPLLGLRHGRKDPEAYKLALNTFMEMRNKDPKYAYKMPAEYQTQIFDKKPLAGQDAQRIVQEWIDKGHIAPINENATRESIKKGALNPDDRTGNTPEETQQNLNTTVENLRYQYLDRRQWVVKQTDKLLAAQNRAELDAETSALVMWRNSDNALNWLPGLMLRGPLSYLGTSVGSGRFENAPVYDNDLAEKYGDDGRIKGLNEIFAPIIDSKDQEVATAYGAAKRILWTKKRRDDLRSVTGQIDEKGNVADYRLRLDLNPATKLKLERFEQAYVDINGLDKEQQISEEELNEVITEVETNKSNKHIVEFWDRYNAYDNHMIKMSYNTGMITREVRDEWLSMPYAPFYRDVAKEEDFPIGSRQEIAKRGKNLVEKALKGSTEPIKTDLADGVIQNTQALVRDAMMNAAVWRTVRDAVSLGTARKIKISALEGVLTNNVVRVMEKGVPVFYELDDAQLAMSTMLLGFNPKKQLQQWFGEHKLGELAQKALTESSGLLRESVTRTPAFTIKNVFRDSWTAMTLTGGGPRLVLQAFKNAFNTDMLRRSDEAGLSIGIDFIAERGKYGHQMQKELDKANLDWKKPTSPFVALWNFSGRIAKQSEVATRLAVYDRILAMTGDKALAQYYAIEIMNYGRRGSSQTLSTYMATVPFMNGRMQGLDVTYRGLRAKKGSSDIPGIAGYGLTADQYEGLPMWQKSRALIVSRGLILTAATSALYFLLRDDEEWQDLRDETKTDNWVLPLSDHAWLKIPIPFELGVLFKVIPEKILEAIMEKDVGLVDVGEETVRQLRTSLSIGGPQLFTPVVNAMRNYDTFRKDDIVDHWMEQTLSPNEQRNQYTSNVARGMADLANSIPLVNTLDFLTSPMKVEYMMRQYGGTMGGYVITVADRIARTGLLMDENVIGTNKDFDFRSMVGGEGVANVPILGDLLTDPRTRGGRQQDFYNALEELNTIVATLRSITARDREKGFAYAEKHANVLRYQDDIRGIQKQLREWRERREVLTKTSSRSMTVDQKRKQYQRLLDSRVTVLRNIDTLMESIKQR